MQRRASSRYGATMACVGQTSMQALQVPQCAAVGPVRGQRQVDEQISPRKNIEPASRDRPGVLAAPAQAAARGQLHLQHRSRVGEHAVPEGPHLGGDASASAAGARAAPCDSRAPGHRPTPWPLRVGQALPLARLPVVRRLARQVVHARGDHADRARHQLGRPRARQAVRGHVGHAPWKPASSQAASPGSASDRSTSADRRSGRIPAPAPTAQPLKQRLHHRRSMSLAHASRDSRNPHPHLARRAACAAFAARLAAAPALRRHLHRTRRPAGRRQDHLRAPPAARAGCAGRIKSPTFAVLEPYDVQGHAAVSHFDFYRFGDPREWDDAGFRDLFAARA
jgi:hypothetical protein